MEARKSEPSLTQLALEAAPYGVVMIDGQGSIVLVNPHTEKMFGYTRDELLGQPVEKLVPRGLRESHKELREAYFERLEAREMGAGRSLFGASKDGSEFPVEIGLKPVEADHEILVLAAIVDVSERMRFQESLERQVSERGNASVDASRAAINMMRDAEQARAEAEQARAEAEQAREAAERHVKELELSRSATMNMMKDIDSARRELTQRAQELERSNKELDDFAYVASHDLRAPLRGIDNLAKWIAEDAAAELPEKSRGHLQKMQQRVQRMEGLLDDMLQYSRAGRVKGHAEEIATGDLIRDTIDLIAPPDGFIICVADEMPTVWSNRAPMQQVFLNLIANAIKHHDRPNGRVDIACRDNGSLVEFTISDDGPGIPAEYHERVFRMFQTLRPRDDVEGSGMGLAVVKKVIESQGGTITVESASGRGACFRFTWEKSEHER